MTIYINGVSLEDLERERSFQDDMRYLERMREVLSGDDNQAVGDHLRQGQQDHPDRDGAPPR